jgi:hypothetical protein
MRGHQQPSVWGIRGGYCSVLAQPKPALDNFRILAQIQNGVNYDPASLYHVKYSKRVLRDEKPAVTSPVHFADPRELAEEIETLVQISKKLVSTPLSVPAYPFICCLKVMVSHKQQNDFRYLRSERSRALASTQGTTRSGSDWYSA